MSMLHPNHYHQVNASMMCYNKQHTLFSELCIRVLHKNGEQMLLKNQQSVNIDHVVYIIVNGIDYQYPQNSTEVHTLFGKMIHNNKPYEIRDVKPIENDVTYLAVGVSYLNSCVVNYNPKHALTYTTLVNQFIDSL